MFDKVVRRRRRQIPNGRFDEEQRRTRYVNKYLIITFLNLRQIIIFNFCYDLNSMSNKSINKITKQAHMVCSGFEPWAAELKVQTDTMCNGR